MSGAVNHCTQDTSLLNLLSDMIASLLTIIKFVRRRPIRMRLFLNVVRTWARSSGDVVERVARLWQRGVGQPHRVAGRRRAARAAAPARPAGGAQPPAARARRRLRAHAAAAAAVSTAYTPHALLTRSEITLFLSIFLLTKSMNTYTTYSTGLTEIRRPCVCEDAEISAVSK